MRYIEGRDENERKGEGEGEGKKEERVHVDSCSVCVMLSRFLLLLVPISSKM